jgi:hypothetical protein
MQEKQLKMTYHIITRKYMGPFLRNRHILRFNFLHCAITVERVRIQFVSP